MQAETALNATEALADTTIVESQPGAVAAQGARFRPLT